MTRRFLRDIAPIQKKDYVVMEVRNNLLPAERKKLLETYDGSTFKRVALVVMGEPPASFKEKTHELMLQDKRARVEQEVRKKHAGKEKSKDATEGEAPQDSLEDEIKKAVDA